MFDEQFRNRLTELRQAKDVSARDMSLSLGQSESYINRIENGKMFPSMDMFFCICEYFNISPYEFFNEKPSLAVELTAIIDDLRLLDPLKREHIAVVIKDLSK